MSREELLHERDSIRIQISLAKDRGQSTAALEATLSGIEDMLAARTTVEPMQFVTLRKRRQKREAP